MNRHQAIAEFLDTRVPRTTLIRNAFERHGLTAGELASLLVTGRTCARWSRRKVRAARSEVGRLANLLRRTGTAVGVGMWFIDERFYLRDAALFQQTIVRYCNSACVQVRADVLDDIAAMVVERTLARRTA